ncbi:MAG: AIPR family protein [Methylococcaceae bacterium]|nr:AIPR family protein [Methylococcaceae bacterium]
MSNNRIILDGCISQYKTENQLEAIDSEIFELFTLAQITKNQNITFENIQNSIVDGSMDGGIDSVIVIVGDEIVDTIDELSDVSFTNKTISKFIISQSKKEGSFKEAVIDKLITSCSVLFDLEKNESALLVRFNSSLVEKVLILRKAWLDTSINGGEIKLEFNYCCNASEVTVNDAFNSKVGQLVEITNKAFSGAEINFNKYSSEELLKLYQTRKLSRLSLSFKEQPLSTSFKEAGIGYVGTVKLGDYKKFLSNTDGQIKDYLFECNIRHFQGLVDVNRKIMGTIANDDSKDFWWLNNGITIIAENPNQVGKTLSIDNVQIVNGLQTSYSIFNNHDGNANDERSVLVKVIINNDSETIDNIIASTNSQNQVSAALLRATEETQRKIELFFLNEGFYYDRRKNYYKNIGKPASKIFSIQFTAQAIETIAFSSPYSARAKPTSLIKENSTYDRIFNPERNFKSYLNCCLILKKTNEFWVNISDVDKKAQASNFKLNLARVAASFAIDKAEYSFDDLAQFDIEKFNNSVFSTSLELLLDTLKIHSSKNKDVSLINMAKSKPFSESIHIALQDAFAQNN